MEQRMYKHKLLKEQVNQLCKNIVTLEKDIANPILMSLEYTFSSRDIINMIENYFGQTVCCKCHRLYPTSLNACLRCCKRLNQLYVLNGKVKGIIKPNYVRQHFVQNNFEKHTIFFYDSCDQDVWDFLIQFGKTDAMMRDTWKRNFDSVTEIRLYKTLIYEQNRKKTYISFTLQHGDENVVYEMCSK